MFNIQIRTIKYAWSQDLVEQKLKAIGQLKDKKVSWIRADLSATQSSIISRWIWTFIAKHFNCLRELIFKVNLEQSKVALKQIGEQLDKTDVALLKIYKNAVNKFNEIAPRHQVALTFSSIVTNSTVNQCQHTTNNNSITQNNYHDYWSKATFKNTQDSIRYHTNKHGNGRTELQYTQDAVNFYQSNKHLQRLKLLVNGDSGYSIDKGTQGGRWTADGKIVTFWY